MNTKRDDSRVFSLMNKSDAFIHLEWHDAKPTVTRKPGWQTFPRRCVLCITVTVNYFHSKERRGHLLLLRPEPEAHRRRNLESWAHHHLQMETATSTERRKWKNVCSIQSSRFINKIVWIVTVCMSVCACMHACEFVCVWCTWQILCVWAFLV